MIGLDTNALARLFVDDDMKQAGLARQFVLQRCSPDNPAFVDRVALCEMVWVLTSVHGYRRNQVAAVLDKLVAIPEIVMEDMDAVRAAIPVFRGRGIDFADILMGRVNRARGCDATATFDRKAAKLDGFTLLG